MPGSVGIARVTITTINGKLSVNIISAGFTFVCKGLSVKKIWKQWRKVVLSLAAVLVVLPILLGAIAVTGGISYLARPFGFQGFSLPTGAMSPTLWVGDYMISDNSAYGDRSPFSAGSDGRARLQIKPLQGDVVVLLHPHDNFIMTSRIIGMPGDRVRMTDGRLYLNGEIVPRTAQEPFQMLGEFDGQFPAYIETLPGGLTHGILEFSDDERGDNMEEVVVPQESYFLMGDNRDRSSDSRFDLGFVPEDYIIGKASLVLFNKTAWMRRRWIE
ncbi:signal peptidase I [Rhizobium herbae]|uniref:Signal peptidase I n=1 Tax=Rhizobium herbae TaxID=508661 RepID=A0ABS4EHV0_9HYPH|nr:signal peptidase I [Rhizobium herbae]MBP1857516.1 signal peptidase I [Rhizobium herbae]